MSYATNCTHCHFNSTVTEETVVKAYNWPVLFLFIIVFVTIGGNIMVCLAVIYQRKLRNMFNYFLVSLAISDMLSAALVMPVTIIKLFVGEDLEVPHLMCMIWYALDVLFTSSTIIHLTMISVDRYRALQYPLKYGAAKRTKHTVLMISIVWVLAFCVAGPLFVLSMYDNKQHVDYKGCGPESPIFIITATVISFYLPLLIMSIMYILTVRALHKQGKIQKQMQKLQRHSGKKYHSKPPPPTMCVSVSMPIDHELQVTEMSQLSMSTNNERNLIKNSRSLENSPLLFRKYKGSITKSTSDNEQLPLQQMALLSPQQQPANGKHCYGDGGSITPSYHSDCADSIQTNSSDSVSYENNSSPINQKIIQPNNAPQSQGKSIKHSFKKRIRSKIMLHSKKHRRHGKRRKGYSSVEKSRKAVQVLGVLFVVFLVCYVPFFLTYLIKGTCLACAEHISDDLLKVFEWMGYSGSMVNPIIYHIFNKQFRTAFYKILKCKPRS